MKQKIFKITFIVIIVLSVFLLYVNKYSLSSIMGVSLQTIDNNLKWEFFEEEFIEPNDVVDRIGTGHFIELPHQLKEDIGTSFTYGTYIAKMVIPTDMIGKEWAFYIPFQYGSYDFYIDGELVNNNGTVGRIKEEQVPEMAPVIGKKIIQSSEIYMVVHLSNFYSIRGGFAKEIRMGEPDVITNQFNTNIIIYFFITGIVFIYGLLVSMIAIFNKKNKLAFYGALFWFTIAIRSLFARPFIYSLTIVDVPWLAAVKIEAICSLIMSMLVVVIGNYLNNNKVPKGLLLLNYVVIIIQVIITLLNEPLVYQKTFSLVFLLLFLTVFYIGLLFIKRRNKVSIDYKVHAVCLFLFILAAIHDQSVVYLIIDSPLLLHLTLVVCVLIETVLISSQFVYRFKEMVRLNKEVTKLNITLDRKIKERTIELELANKKLKRLASTDGLTNIANRYIFDKRLEQEFIKIGKENIYLSLLMIDLDLFKKYNDYYGHIAGDELLIKVVNIIEGLLPEEAIFARYGGEEFAIILPNYNQGELQIIGQKLLEAIRESKLEHVCQECGIATISIGGFTITNKDEFSHVKELIEEADKLLYLAKKKGGNTFCNR